MINRRTLLTSAPAAAAATAATGALAAGSTTASATVPSRDVRIDVNDMPEEYRKVLGIRFRSLDAESQLNFVTGLVKARGRMGANREAQAAREAFLRAKGYNSLDDVNLDYEQCHAIMMQAPGHAAVAHFSSHTQQIMWDRARRALVKDWDYWMDELDKAQARGPGKLELNPALVIPDSARHEIHQQPGGFCGDPLAGVVYHYAVTLGFRGGTANYDENHMQNGMNRRKPADGRVLRILDLGCGTGQSTTPLKMRFPEAEVWGVDIAAPMLRYANYRAQKMGLEVNFRQADAAATGFPDGHFDLVCEHLMFHEASVENGEAIVREAYRLLRPGGILDHSDMGTVGHPKNAPARNLPAKARAFETQRRNNYEPHWNTYANWDFPGALRRAGFEPKYDVPPSVGASGHMYGEKPLRA